VDHKKLSIRVTVTEKSSSVVYTEKQVAKEQLRLVAHVEVYDSEHNQLANKGLDVFSTYEVGDDMPYSDSISKTQVLEDMIQELANSVTLMIVNICHNLDRG
jgi:hypothetical protein